MVTEQTTQTESQPAALPPITDTETPAEPVVSDAVTETADDLPVEPAESAGEEETPPDKPQPFDPQRYDADEVFKEHVGGIEKRSRREGYLEALDKVDADDLKSTQFLQHIQAGIQGLNDMLAESGLDEATLNRALQKNAPQLGVFKSWNEQEKLRVAIEGHVSPEGTPVGGMKQAVVGMMRMLAKDLGDSDFGDNYAGRWLKETRIDGGQEAFQDFVKDYKKRIKKEAEAPHLKRIADLETQIAGGKVAARKGGPDTAPKGGDGGRPTPAQYAAATSEQRAEWAAKGIEPLTQ